MPYDLEKAPVAACIADLGNGRNGGIAKVDDRDATEYANRSYRRLIRIDVCNLNCVHTRRCERAKRPQQRLFDERGASGGKQPHRVLDVTFERLHEAGGVPSIDDAMVA